MKVRLKYLTEIQSGYPFRGAVVAGPPQCGVAVVQMRDLGEKLVPDLREVDWNNAISVKPVHLLKFGDVLFRGRGNAPAGYCLRKLPALCIAAVYFEGNAQGSAMRMVGIDVLENLMIPVIPLEKQQKIIELVELSERERELAQKLIALKSVYINKTVNQWLGE